jgi:hypothetical protein
MGETAMRLPGGIVLAGLLMAQLPLAGGAAGQQCLHPPERAAFDTAGLKTQLMITALTCDVREKYNAFVRRFQPELMLHERMLRSYFIRSFGPRGQQRHDDYVTSLANVESQAGLHDGTLFCQRHVAMFDEVLALPKPGDLARYAASRELVQPVLLESCGTTQTAEARGAARRR